MNTEIELITLFVIVLMAFLCPIVSAIIPRKLVPETVFLLIAGMIIGPNVLGIAQSDTAVTLLSDLGLGFLFLLAGYEIDPKELSGSQGRSGLITWFVTFGLAIATTAAFSGIRDNFIGWMATSIALTTTAFGTLIPILKDRGLIGSRIGRSIVMYGTWGEICPIVAIAIILSTRKTWVTLTILLIFTLIAVLAAVLPKKIWEKSTQITQFFERNADSNSQMTVRSVMVLLVGLVAVSAVFDLDIVLGSFAAGFVLRFILPSGDADLEHKLNGIGYGFFIPLFFIVSGMGIDPMAIIQEPLLLVVFIITLLLVRALPIYISLKVSSDTKDMDQSSRATIALYCTTALPLIVAVTTIATNAGAMTEDVASLLVGAGGITVLLMPLLASLTLHALNKQGETSASN